MINMKWRLLGLLLVATLCSACLHEFPTYRFATDGLHKSEYLVVGRVLDSQGQPIENCRVWLTMRGIDCTLREVPPSYTDYTGTYQIMFELKTCAKYCLTFDARDQGYPLRYQSISHLLESTLFQYTANNPIVMNVIMNRTVMVPPMSQRVESAAGF